MLLGMRWNSGRPNAGSMLFSTQRLVYSGSSRGPPVTSTSRPRASSQSFSRDGGKQKGACPVAICALSNRSSGCKHGKDRANSRLRLKFCHGLVRSNSRTCNCSSFWLVSSHPGRCCVCTVSTRELGLHGLANPRGRTWWLRTTGSRIGQTGPRAPVGLTVGRGRGTRLVRRTTCSGRPALWSVCPYGLFTIRAGHSFFLCIKSPNCAQGGGPLPTSRARDTATVNREP